MAAPKKKKTAYKDLAVGHRDVEGIEMAYGPKGMHFKETFLNSDGSWNLNNPTVNQILAKHEKEGSPFDLMTKADRSKLMQDEGRRLDIADTILKVGMARPKPITEEQLMERLYEYFALCQHHCTPPTYPLFAVWCGMSIGEMEKSHARIHGLRNAVALCRETIRGFLELSAMDNALSPLIYFHQQKVYFGAVETAKIQVEETQNDEERLQEIEDLVTSLKENSPGIIDIGEADVVGDGL